jgi:RNA polymerase sigma-B factor
MDPSLRWPDESHPTSRPACGKMGQELNGQPWGGAMITEEQRPDAAEERLLQKWEPLTRHLVNRFGSAWSADREDLLQVARLALIEAARGYDPKRGCRFSTFAINSVLWALRHYVRDRVPTVRVPRRWSDLRARLRQEEEAFAQETGREPTVAELAARLGASEADVAGTLEAYVLCHPGSLDDAYGQPDSAGPERRAGGVGVNDPRLEAAEQRLALHQAMEELPRRLRKVLQGRFFQGLTQQEVGRAMGLSQMQIYRLERQALSLLRRELYGIADVALAASVP